MVRCYECPDDNTNPLDDEIYWVDSQCYFDECPTGYYIDSGDCSPCSDVDTECLECLDDSTCTLCA